MGAEVFLKPDMFHVLVEGVLKLENSLLLLFCFIGPACHSLFDPFLLPELYPRGRKLTTTAHRKPAIPLNGRDLSPPLESTKCTLRTLCSPRPGFGLSLSKNKLSMMQQGKNPFLASR